MYGEEGRKEGKGRLEAEELKFRIVRIVLKGYLEEIRKYVKGETDGYTKVEWLEGDGGEGVVIRGRVAREVGQEFGIEDGDDDEDEVGEGWRDPGGWVRWWSRRYAIETGRRVRPRLEREVEGIEDVVYMRDLRVWGEWIEMAERFGRGEETWDDLATDWRERARKVGEEKGTGVEWGEEDGVKFEGGIWRVDIPRGGRVGGLLSEGYRKGVNGTFDLMVMVGGAERWTSEGKGRRVEEWVVGGVMRGWMERLRETTDAGYYEGGGRGRGGDTTGDLWVMAGEMEERARVRDGVGGLRDIMREAVKEGYLVVGEGRGMGRFRNLVGMCRGWSGERWDPTGWFKFKEKEKGGEEEED
ncbi:hypothetical protein TrCOL_g8060 [Triparma columacea]|uniref:Uncharacterized protein n=1 Tax=Triparma columacea TaxID=722753 RepID=A0A9W7GPT1_9STRA|nr:hypothetical protein TrCOL_g8060 [Triparma columacea]